jgi:hypothetical protein
VISATFWWWLWGTVGLVLSTPLTVCIFGDEPPLTPVENFYQRMLAGDASEVVDQAEEFLKTNSLIDYYDADGKGDCKAMRAPCNRSRDWILSEALGKLPCLAE